MKKISFIIILGLLPFLVFSEIRVKEITGQVEWMQPASQNWEKIESGAVIPPSSRISTGFNSTVTLDMGESGQVKLKPLTRLTIEEALEQADGNTKTRLFLGSGRIRADVRKNDRGINEFRVGSPIATAAVRGTGFDFSQSRLRVDEGQVLFSVGAYRFSVSRGQSNRVVVISGKLGLKSTVDAIIESRQVSAKTGQTGGSSNQSAGKTGFAVIYLQ